MKKIFLIAGLMFGVFSTSSIAMAQKLEIAVFAGGCFWCVESDFDHVPGVVKTISGYTGGPDNKPDYHSYIKKGHIEAVEIHFDPAKTSYQQLLNVFWHSVDPTDPGGQFCDRGPGYVTAIFAKNKKQTEIANKSRAALIKANPDKKIVTQILPAKTFFQAERYHQGYAARNPIRYNYYRRGCGRDRRVKQVWGKLAHQGITKH